MMLVKIVVSSYYRGVPMTELRYSVTVTQVAGNDKNLSLISNGWYVLKPDPHTCFK
jgi:hypothetical protein